MTDQLARIAGALRARYILEHTLQSGVAAHVHLARERMTGRRVAVKVLREELATTVDAHRFTAEIRVCAALRHPNIVPVLDSGDADGLPYYVMPFIEGETLRDRLEHLGRLPLTEALRIAEDVARALDFAHRHHIVHRDIKPENILLTGERLHADASGSRIAGRALADVRGPRALVLDFGIALATDGADAPRRTLPGLTLGTVHYMSPEQAAGDPNVDARSDIYSLACVVHEMISGRPPITGSPAAVIRRHLMAESNPLGALCPGVPREIARVLARALLNDPAARHATAGDFLGCLQAAVPCPRAGGHRLGVVCFTNVTGRPALDAFADGIGEELAAALRGIGGVAVAARAWRGDGSGVHVREIARRVEADVLLFGDVRTCGDDRLQLAASLHEARTGRRFWSAVFSGRSRDGLDQGFGSVAELALAVGAALGIAKFAGWSDREAREATPLFRDDVAPTASNGWTAAG